MTTQSSQPANGGYAPFAPGSISLALHLLDGDGERQAEVLLRHATAAERAGFDGVSVSEHHVGFPGYMPQPLLAANWILGRTTRVWCGPFPTLLPLWNPALLAEQLAWTAACFPGRLGAAFAMGWAADDFKAVGVSRENLTHQFEAGLGALVEALSPSGPLSGDPAIEQWNRTKPPLLTAANSRTAARRAARHGMGMLLGGAPNPAGTMNTMVDAYRTAGGEGPVVWPRRVWIGTPPQSAVEAMQRAFSGWSPSSDTGAEFIAGTADEIAATLRTELEPLGDATLHLKPYFPGVSPEELQAQIEQLGEEVLPPLRRG